MGTKSIEYRRKYFQENRERIVKTMYEKISCPLCGSVVSKSHMNRHQKTKKCEKMKKA